MTRRDLNLLLPGLLCMAVAEADAQDSYAPLPMRSRVFLFDKLPTTHSAGGALTRPILKGQLPTGEWVELHETTLMPGQMPHPAHKHVHTEFMLIRQGNVEFLMGDKSEQVGPGGVTYAASGEMHGIRNTAATPATYFVIAIGNETEAKAPTHL
jgi:mannose-6-phosphate isomerase-like protein (cupin superfamily)